jgi:hypothetical protein
MPLLCSGLRLMRRGILSSRGVGESLLRGGKELTAV